MVINNEIFDRTGGSAITTIGTLQDNILGNLLSNNTLSKLIDAEAESGTAAYSIIDFLNDLKKGVWTELPARKRIDVYRRNLQKSYIGLLNGLLNSPKAGNSGGGSIIITFGGSVTQNNDKSDIKSVVRAHLLGFAMKFAQP